jgi:hypothetical protein
MQMDDQAAKVRMAATKAEKLKLAAMKQLEALAGTLAVVADKADADQLKSQVRAQKAHSLSVCAPTQAPPCHSGQGALSTSIRRASPTNPHKQKSAARAVCG